jgi:hypothetical protein
VVPSGMIACPFASGVTIQRGRVGNAEGTGVGRTEGTGVGWVGAGVGDTVRHDVLLATSE